MRALMTIVYIVGRTNMNERLSKPVHILGSISKVQRKMS